MEDEVGSLACPLPPCKDGASGAQLGCLHPAGATEGAAAVSLAEGVELAAGPEAWGERGSRGRGAPRTDSCRRTLPREEQAGRGPRHDPGEPWIGRGHHCGQQQAEQSRGLVSAGPQIQCKHLCVVGVGGGGVSEPCPLPVIFMESRVQAEGTGRGLTLALSTPTLPGKPHRRKPRTRAPTQSPV